MKLLAVGVFLRCLPPLLTTMDDLEPLGGSANCKAAGPVAAAAAAEVAWDCNHAAPCWSSETQHN